MSDQSRKSRFSLGAESRRIVGRFGRLAREVGARVWDQLWLSSGLVVAVVALGIGLSIAVSWQLVPATPPLTVAMALRELDAENFAVARKMAGELRWQDDLAEEDLGTPAYILGVILAEEIEREWRREERAGLQTLAIGYLEEARNLGFPPDRAGEAELLLGKLHFDSGHFAQSLPSLTAALAALPEQATSIHRDLAEAYVRDADPDWEQARHHLEAFLSDPLVDAESRGRAELELARVHFERDDLRACDAVLSQVREESPDYPEALMLRGRVMLREAEAIARDGSAAGTTPSAALDRYAEADAIFTQLVTRIARQGDLVRQARYLGAISQLRKGSLVAAEEQLASLRRGNFNTHEGLAAGVALAELQEMLGRDDEVVTTLQSVVKQAGEMDTYENRWISLGQLRKHVEQAYLRFIDDEQFERALMIAEALAPIAPPERSVELSANAERGWARQLDSLAAHARLVDQAELFAKARAAWMRAGQRFEDLAQLRFSTRKFPEDVWDSADCYFHGHAYQRTAKLLQLYMKNETRRNRPPALTLLGQAHLALGNPEESLKWLTECIQFFSKDPHSYRARIVAAKANQELGNLDAAKQLLIGNLEHEALTPRSQEWRESKYALGRILHQQGVMHEAQSRLKGVKDPNADQRKEGLRELELARNAFQLAIEQLREAVQRDALAERDPFERETLEARYYIAESHRQSAKFARRKLPTVTIETTRVALSREMKRELNAAADAYFDLQITLNQKLEQSELTPVELKLLRNCYFAQADALYDLEKYDVARKAYSTATNRYQHEPESLEAYVQIANCQRHENRPEDALGTLELAKVVLERIRPDADFQKTTRYSRSEWGELLDWLTAL